MRVRRFCTERNPLDRVRKVAPYLSVDSKPYPAIVNNRVQWIVDAYTTSDQFPYAQGSSQDAAPLRVLSVLTR